MQNDVGREVAPELGQPDAHLGERGAVSDGIAEDAGVGSAVVQARYRSAEKKTLAWFGRREEEEKSKPESFLPSRVPNLQPHNSVALVVYNSFGQEAGSDCRGRTRGRELVLDISATHISK